MKQTVLTFLAVIKPGKTGELRTLLEEVACDVEHNDVIPFRKLKLLHFASLLVVDDPAYPAYLVFENNFDGPLEPYLRELCAQASEGLHRIYSCCVDYPGHDVDTSLLFSFLLARVRFPDAYHIGNVGRSLERVRAENMLRDTVEDFLDGVVAEKITTPTGIREKVQGFVRNQPELTWSEETQPRRTPMENFMPRLKIAFAVLLALLVSPFLIPLLIVAALILRWTETHEAPPADLNVRFHVRELVEREDRTHIVQNHLAHISIVKPGRFRLGTLRVVLWLTNLVARTQDRGKLIGIPSIHFAHWSIIDGGRRLLFLSNFDGSWENYLDDFIDKVSFGLTAIWCNTVDFPRTRFLFFDGARDGSRFKTYTRDKQTRTNVWYSAYKQLTVETIDNNSSIREGLFAPLNDDATRDWVRRF